jgi:iron complex outermembrane recepter protein
VRFPICPLLLLSSVLPSVAFAETAEEVRVRGARPLTSERLIADDADSARFASTGDALAELPGVAVVKRGAAASEPVVRGMSGERVITQLGHLPLLGACPSGMDPPLSYLRPHAFQRVLVLKGLPSVIYGPMGSGGRLVVLTAPEPSSEDPPVGGTVRIGYNSARSGDEEEGIVRTNADWMKARWGASRFVGHDYRSGAGTLVPAHQREASASAAVALFPAKGHRLEQDLNYVRHDDVDYPALPMNLRFTDFVTYSTRYRGEFQGGSLREVYGEGGVMHVTHQMDNAGKPNRGATQAVADSTVRNFAAVAGARWELTSDLRLQAGVDAGLFQRDATRRTRVTATGRNTSDHLWPAAEQFLLGAFAELHANLSRPVRLRIGARADRAASRARAADHRSALGTSIRDAYARFYGADATKTSAVEGLLSGNVRLELVPTEELVGYAGLGLRSRPAGINERYYAFAPAPDGYQLGNPTLSQEKLLEGELGATWSTSWLTASAAIYLHRIFDYVLPTTIAREDVNGDGTADLVRGYRNVEARLFGAELQLVPRAGRFVSFPTTASALRGDDLTYARPLPLIPPFQLRTAVRVQSAGETSYWGEAGVRVVATQSRVDLAYSEDRTPGFAVAHVRTGASLWGRVRLELGVENLFDANYHEHLMRDAVMAVGDLRAGEAIPEPGRFAYVNVRGDL